jgi:para-aminobenzoate synthetase component 1
MTLRTPLTRAVGPSAAELRRVCAEPYGVWLDAAAPDGWSGGSLLATEPSVVMRVRRGAIELAGRGGTRRCTADPFDVLRELLAERAGGRGCAVGYLAYDLKRHVERLRETTADDLALSDAYVCFYDDVRRFDAHRGAPATPPASSGAGVQPAVPDSTFTPGTYRGAVARVLEHIVAGDVYQVNLSQRFCVPVSGDVFSAYERLRAATPAAFGAYLNFPELGVLSASPELFLRLDATTRRIETRPIKGTRPRGATPQDDARLGAELLASEKDRAENVMIVDLERNDLGRVAEIGSVHVTGLAALQVLPTVHHLVSTVEATLRQDRDAIDLLRAAFPGGSITGAPKIRAMQIIDAVEPVVRGVYTGAIGRFGYDGSLDLNIAIRTAVVVGGDAYVHAGGGIVADSDPEAEYQETLDKVRAIVGALAAADE